MMGFTHPTCLIDLAAFVGEARKARREYTLRLLPANDDGFHPSYIINSGLGCGGSGVKLRPVAE